MRTLNSRDTLKASQGMWQLGSSFGKLDGSSAGEAETAWWGCLMGGEAKVVVFSRALRRWGGGARGGPKLFGGTAGGEKQLTGIVRDGA